MAVHSVMIVAIQGGLSALATIINDAPGRFRRNRSTRICLGRPKGGVTMPRPHFRKGSFSIRQPWSFCE